MSEKNVVSRKDKFKPKSTAVAKAAATTVGAALPPLRPRLRPPSTKSKPAARR